MELSPARSYQTVASLDALNISSEKTAFCVGLILAFLASAFSDTTLVRWNMRSLTDYGPSPLAPTTNAAGLTITGLTRGLGVETSGTAAGSACGGTNRNKHRRNQSRKLRLFLHFTSTWIPSFDNKH
jgi:hypothetical protein